MPTSLPSDWPRPIEGRPSDFATLSPTRRVRGNWETDSGLRYNKRTARKESVTLEEILDVLCHRFRN
jgi:hypothetical protein